MNETIDIQTREAFVIYSPTRGFIKNKNKDFTEDFEHARLFSKKEHATSSVLMGKLVGALVIPVGMTLDPRKLFVAALKGA